MFKFLFFSFALGLPCLTTGSAEASATTPSAVPTMKYVYQPGEGDNDIPCVHTIENAASQDWKVICQPPPPAVGGNAKEFLVHLWITPYPHATGPSRISYEILYWVTDRSKPAPATSILGSTIWFHLKDASAIYAIELSQWVENGAAELTLQFVNE